MAAEALADLEASANGLRRGFPLCDHQAIGRRRRDKVRHIVSGNDIADPGGCEGEIAFLCGAKGHDHCLVRDINQFRSIGRIRHHGFGL